MKKLIFTLMVVCSVLAVNAKTLIVYYSYTHNVERIVTELRNQIEADVVEIEPAEKGLDYAADNYAIGSAQISAIRNNPDDASSYPAIDQVNVNLADYDFIIIGAPLWWSNMAAPLQTYLFHSGADMAGKKIGLIVSSASSGISGVEADAKRLIPDGDFVSPSLWIRSSQTSNSRTMIENWLTQIDYNNITSGIVSVTSDNGLGFHFASGTINIDGDFDSLALYNLSGNKVLESSASIVNTSALVPGIYVARISAGSSTISKKITITR